MDKPFIYYFSHDDNFTSAAADEFNRNEQTGQHKHKVGPYVEHSHYDAIKKELDFIKAARDKCQKTICEDCGSLLQRF
jgi:hypothetical protein